MRRLRPKDLINLFIFDEIGDGLYADKEAILEDEIRILEDLVAQSLTKVVEKFNRRYRE